jgi:hypothetical protein
MVHWIVLLVIVLVIAVAILQHASGAWIGALVFCGVVYLAFRIPRANRRN